MRLLLSVALAVLPLVLCCLCEAAIQAQVNAKELHVNATETQVNATKPQVNATNAQGNVTDAKVNTTDANGNATSESSEMAKRTLQKVVRWVRRVLQSGDYAYPGSDSGREGSDVDYLLNEDRGFGGHTYSDLEDNRIRGLTESGNKDFGVTWNSSITTDRGLAPDTSNRDFAPETRNSEFSRDSRNTEFVSESKDRGLMPNMRKTVFAPETKDSGLTPVTKNTEPGAGNRGLTAPVTRDYAVIQNRALGAEQDFGTFQTQPYAYNFRDRQGKGPETNGIGQTNFRSPTTREFDLSRRSADAGRELQQSQSMNSVGQRWLRILAEFLRASPEGRQLLREQAGQLLEGVDLESGELPRPVLLLPVPLQTQGSNQRPVDENEEFHRTLLELFRLARPRAPLLPPLLLPTSPRPAPAAPLPPISPMPPSARLHFDRSLLIRAELTVFYSDYTEPYTVWYEAESGSSRVDLHGGSTVLFRDVQSAGDVQRVQFRIERFGDDELRRCTWLTTRAVAADRALPGLPDPAPFSFTGYQDTADGRLERWSYRLAGQAGELGAARGEALVFRHELLVARVGPDFAIPYRYRVTVDSSVLGPEVDRYEHRYLEVREQRPDPGHLSIDVKRQCDALQRAHRVDQVDPLREFVMTHRDSRCDADFEKFKETHQIKYDDPVDEAVRKTLLIRSTRFVESANRQGATAKMENNAVGVMLPAEQRLLRGIGPSEDAGDADDASETEDDDGAKGSGGAEGSKEAEGSGGAEGSKEAEGSGGTEGGKEAEGSGGAEGGKEAEGSGGAEGGKEAEGSGGAEGGKEAEGSGGAEGGKEAEGSGGAEEGAEGEDGVGILGAPPKAFATLEPLPFPYSTQEVTRMAAELQDAFSWKRQGGVTHIRNQGYCTSCWAFAVVCAVEGALFRRTRKLVPLSDQQLADCTRSKRSCSETGVVRNAYLQARNSGIIALSDYPQYMYKNPKLEQCRKKEPVVTKISGFVQVPSNTAAIKISIVQQGPVVVEVDSSCGGFRFYRSGVLRDMRCNPEARNHAVAAVGFGRHKTIGDYFIIKNSWGAAGNSGYVNLHAESNTAGVLTSPSYPVLEDEDILNKSRLDSLAKSYSDEPSIYQTDGDAEYMAFLKQQKEYLDKHPEVQARKRRK